MPQELHRLARQGDLPGAQDFLNSAPPDSIDINAYDRGGRTPLMHAAASPLATVAMVTLLLDRGANLHLESRARYAEGHSTIALALSGGDPQKVAVLIERGANIHYKREHDYTAALDAVYSRDVLRDPRLLDLLKLLIANGVALSTVTGYNESALGRLNWLGRYDAVRLLLDAGADASRLEWTPLIRAVALGSLTDVVKSVDSANLEDRDRAERTAWLVAVQTGDLRKAQFLLKRGANPTAGGRCEKPSLFYAIENFHSPMLKWLLKIGVPIDQVDQFGSTALITAAECGNVGTVNILLAAGADVNAERDGQSALSFARTRPIAARLLRAGADPAKLSGEGRRALLGFDPESNEDLLNVSPQEFLNGLSPRFGTSNPERIVDPFWEGMIRSGLNPYVAKQLFAGRIPNRTSSPAWCAQRFGQSITLLPDGRIVQVAGEHEDSYDPDFCIYNDVFVHHPDGAIHIFGYPEEVFPPTDFHTATLFAGYLYLIGSLGYQGTRQYGKTPVYRLDLNTFRIEQVETSGEAPGWIYKHRAVRTAPHEIRISGGTIVTHAGGDQESHGENADLFVLNTRALVWRRGTATTTQQQSS
jgi:ankyrin repeat protein